MSAAAEVRAFLSNRDNADASVDPAMRSTVLEGAGDTTVVLLHGLTASPPAWAAVASDLNARGASVVSVRLPFHGHTDRLSTALEGLSADLLTVDLRVVIEAAATLGKRTVVGGHSLGGTLAIHAAATLPQVDRVVAVAPFLGIASLPHELHALLVRSIYRLPNLFLWWDPVERAQQQPGHGYPRYPLHALAVGLQIADAVYADARQLPCAHAIDLVINAQESSVNNRTVRRLAQRWRAVSAPVAVHRLVGLPPSHDIIEPSRTNSTRVRALLVELLLADLPSQDTVHAI